ncbi:hypothetical protein [Holzapfeliella sp. JNUCC 80]
MKTVRELSQEIGITKQSINQYITSSTELKKHVKQIKRANHIDEKGEKIIIEHFKNSIQTKKKFQKDSKNIPEERQKASDNFQYNAQIETIKILREELKDRTRQLDSAHKLIDQQQKLTLQSNATINELKQKVENEKEEKNKALKLLENSKKESQKSSEDNQQSYENLSEGFRKMSEDSLKISKEQQKDSAWWKFWK